MDIDLIIRYLSLTWKVWFIIFIYLVLLFVILNFAYSKLVGSSYNKHELLNSFKSATLSFCFVVISISLLFFIDSKIINFDYFKRFTLSTEIKVSDILQVATIFILIITFIATLKKSNQNIEESRFSRIQEIEKKNSSKVDILAIRASGNSFNLYLGYYEKIYDFKIAFYDETKKKLNLPIKVGEHVINSIMTKIDEIKFNAIVGKKEVKSNRLDIEVDFDISKTKYVSIEYLSEHLNKFLDLYELKESSSKPWYDYSYKLIARDYPWCKEGWMSNEYIDIHIYEEWIRIVPNKHIMSRVKEKISKTKEEIKKIFSKSQALVIPFFSYKSDANEINISFEIKIVNIGRRTINIDAIGIDIGDNEELLYQYPYPIILQGSQTFNAKWKIETLKQIMDKKIPKYVFVKFKNKKIREVINLEMAKHFFEEYKTNEC